MNDLNNTKQQGEAFDRLHVTDTEIVNEVVQDVQSHLDYAANLRAIDYKGPSREMYHAAHFPDNIINLYCQTNGVQYSEIFSDPIHIRRMMNDPALKNLRIWEGRV